MLQKDKSIKIAFLEKQKVRMTFYLGSLFSVFLLAIILFHNFSINLKTIYDQKINQLADSITNEKKVFLKCSIEQMIYNIESRKKAYFENNKNATDESFKESIKPDIRNLRLVNDGYIWINEILNYDGGDNYAFRFVHPNLPHTEGSYLSTNTEDISGKKPYKIELDGINNYGELYFEYYFKEMKSDKISHKMSYAKLYKPYNWVVATGIYLNDVDALIEREKQKMYETTKHQTISAIILTLIALALTVIVLIFIEKHINKMINSYEEKVNIYTEKLIEQKDKTKKALEEIKKLKGLLPICSHCKNIRDDKGYWNKIEKYLEEHSEVSFTHGLCPDCIEKLYGKEDWYRENPDS